MSEMINNLEKMYGVDLKTAVHITPTLHDRYRGKSAYEIAVEYGYTGTEEEFATFLANSAEYARQAKEAMEAAAASEQEAQASEAEVKRIEAELRSVVQAANQAIANTNKAIQAADGVAAEARAAAQQASNAATTATNAAAQAAQTASDAAAQAVQTAETAAQNAADLAGEAKREAEEATATANQAAEDAQEALSGANAAIAQMTPVREAAETAAAAAETATANAESATEAALAAAKRAEDAAGKNLPLATTTTHGVVKIGENLTITKDGTLSAQNSYELPAATEETLGGIKVGANLSIDENGVLSADEQRTDLTDVENRLTTAEGNIDTLRNDVDSKASQDDLDDLRKEIEGYEFRTVTENYEAYSVDVPAKVMPFASVSMVGGKTIVSNGTLKSADVKSIKGKNSIPIPSSVRNIEGYGWSAGSVYNYVDLDRKLFVKRVGRVDLGSISWSQYVSSNGTMISSANQLPLAKAETKNICPAATYVPGGLSMVNGGKGLWLNGTGYTDVNTFKAAMNGVYMTYELETPVETPIDIPSNILQVEAGGTIIFEQEDDTMRIPVPSEISYIKHLGGDS